MDALVNAINRHCVHQVAQGQTATAKTVGGTARGVVQTIK